MSSVAVTQQPRAVFARDSVATLRAQIESSLGDNSRPHCYFANACLLRLSRRELQRWMPLLEGYRAEP